MPRSESGQFGRGAVTQNCSAVTAAALAIRKSVYLNINKLNAGERLKKDDFSLYGEDHIISSVVKNNGKLRTLKKTFNNIVMVTIQTKTGPIKLLTLSVRNFH